MDLLLFVAFGTIIGLTGAVNDLDLFSGEIFDRIRFVSFLAFGLATICSEFQSDWSFGFIFSGSTLLDLQRDFD